MNLTEKEFEALFQQCPTFEDCIAPQIKEYKNFDARVCRLMDDLAERLDREGLNQLASLLDLFHLEELLQFRYYFCQGLLAGRKEK